MRGGTAIESAAIDAPARAAHDLGVPVHLDGARLANAAVARDRDMADFTDEVDSATLCLSKGLGAPVGTVLAGSADLISAARNYRHAFGGGLRQAGIAAAPGLVALEAVERLADDHDNAAVLAEILGSETSLSVTEPETNLLIADANPATIGAVALLERCADRGVRGSHVGGSRVRFCTHRDVDREDVETAAETIVEAV